MKITKRIIAFALIFCMSLSVFTLWGCEFSLGHTHGWDEWNVTTMPTCNQAGEEIRNCLLKESCSPETRLIEALGHDLLWICDDAEHSVPYGVCQRDGCNYQKESRCEDCNVILNSPYSPRHSGHVEEGVFWEVPIKQVGDSLMHARMGL